MHINNQLNRQEYVQEGEKILNSLFTNSLPWTLDNHSTKIYNKDEPIYSINEPSKHVFLVAEGRVKIGTTNDQNQTIVKYVIDPDEIFGEMALTGELIRSEFAVSLEDNTKVCILSKEKIIEMMDDNRDVSENILQVLGARIRKTENRLEALIHKDARTRIIDFIRDLGVNKGKKVGFETMVKNYLTHKDIASLTGTSRQTVTTVLNDLKEKNIINFDRRRILIRDMDLLA